MEKGLIYCATNVLNGKKYIGQTIQGLAKRRRQHELATDGTAFHCALKKYGLKAFNWTILQDNIDYTELDQYEQDYIAKYNTYKKGYNSTIGGREADTFHSTTYVIQCVETGVIYQSIRQAERSTKISNANISKALCGKRKTAGGYHWVQIGVSTL